MQKTYILDSKSIKQVLSSVCNKWRQHKCRLTSFVLKYRQYPHVISSPPEIYEDEIEEEDWKDFVSVRLFEEWQVRNRLIYFCKTLGAYWI